MKKLYDGMFDVVLAVMVISFFVFVDSIIILIGFAAIMYLVVEHYLIMRSCYLSSSK